MDDDILPADVCSVVVVSSLQLAGRTGSWISTNLYMSSQDVTEPTNKALSDGNQCTPPKIMTSWNSMNTGGEGRAKRPRLGVVMS